MTADYQTLLEMWRDEKQKREKAEDKIKELEGTLKSAQNINDTYQRDTSRLQLRLTEVEEDNKKLAKQIEDLIIPRKHGM
jgi:chromosome segregation ATPase|tara:strand:- start:1582 stop:1821 length:240 start_codon:yes stop_codon:yes gene_type:complete